MEKHRLLLSFSFFLIYLLTGYEGVQGTTHHHHHHHHHHHIHHRNGNGRPTKLFVFGDSYVDTGNNKKSQASSWKVPYGVTFPGKPAGRFSDGRVLTDFIARFMGIRSPVPYQWRKFGGKRLCNGMNFAFGGTGVFNTLVMDPNMTVQIDFFEKLIKDSMYTKVDLQSSIVLVALSGNDYGAFTARNGSAQGLQAFIRQVVNQLAVNLKRIQSLGVKKIVVTALQPLGCLPTSTVLNSFQQCNDTQNTAVGFHNLLLQQAVAKLNNETKDSPFNILDLFAPFTLILKNQGSMKFETPLKPCCMGISNQHFCGSVDDKGAKMYTVCPCPQSAFFWDTVHPTQAGWHAVYSTIQATLQQLF